MPVNTQMRSWTMSNQCGGWSPQEVIGVLQSEEEKWVLGRRESGSRSHQHGEELGQCCFKEKEVWERREGGIKIVCVRKCAGSPPRSETRQHKKRPVRKRQLQSCCPAKWSLRRWSVSGDGAAGNKSGEVVDHCDMFQDGMINKRLLSSSFYLLLCLSHPVLNALKGSFVLFKREQRVKTTLLVIFSFQSPTLDNIRSIQQTVIPSFQGIQLDRTISISCLNILYHGFELLKQLTHLLRCVNVSPCW